MDFHLSPEQEQWGREGLDFAESRLRAGATDREKAHHIPPDLIREMGQRGLLGVNIPKSLGGSEAGVVSYAVALREIAAVDASLGVTMAVTNMVGEIIRAFGTPEQQERHIPKLTSGEYFAGAFALSEPGSGSDAAAMTARAERIPEGWRLNGEKAWITSGDQAGVIVVWARTGGPETKHRGISCFLVEGNQPGVVAGKPEEKMGLRASHTVGLSLNDVIVPETARLGREGEGFKIAMTALDGGRIGIASQALGMGRSAFRLARKHVLSQDKAAVAGAQDMQFRLADMMTRLDSAWLLTLRAAWLKERGQPFTQEAAMAKVMATEGANKVILDAMRVQGAEGGFEDGGLTRLYRDCRVTEIYEGTSEIQRVVIAKNLLG